MSTDRTRRIVLVTGANRGIGFEPARQLARRGFHVIVAARDEASRRQAAAAINAEGGTASPLLLDVSNSASIQAAAREFSRDSYTNPLTLSPLLRSPAAGGTD